MTSEAPEQGIDPAAVVAQQQVWARPGTATLQPPPAPTIQPAPPPPVPTPGVPVPSGGRRRGATLILTALALTLGIAAIIMATIKLTAPAPTPTTITMTAPPPSYNPQEAAAAKKEACDAVMTTDAAISGAEQRLVSTLHDRGSEAYRLALANFQLVAITETDYIRSHIRPATPKNVADAINDGINALIALVEANTRELPNEQISPFVARVHQTGDRMGEVCE